MFCGIEKNSFNDFPNKISCVLFLTGCNFFCPYCHNPQTIINPNIINDKKIFNLIKKQKKICDGIVISGGEPTLNKELMSTCKKIKDIGYKIKLDTNGSRPKILYKLLKYNLIDYIAMDLKTYPSDLFYKQFTNEPQISSTIKESINLIINLAPDYEFRTTCVNPLINHEIIKRICLCIKGAKRYTLQPFNKNANSILNKEFFTNHNPTIPKKKILNFIKTASLILKKCKINTIV